MNGYIPCVQCAWGTTLGVNNHASSGLLFSLNLSSLATLTLWAQKPYSWLRAFSWFSLRVFMPKVLVLVLVLVLKGLAPGKPHSVGKTKTVDHSTFLWKILLQNANQANPFTPIRPLLKSCFLSETLWFPPSPLQLPLSCFTFITFILCAYYVLYILIFIICDSSIAPRIAWGQNIPNVEAS